MREDTPTGPVAVVRGYRVERLMTASLADRVADAAPDRASGGMIGQHPGTASRFVARRVVLIAAVMPRRKHMDAQRGVRRIERARGRGTPVPLGDEPPPWGPR